MLTMVLLQLGLTQFEIDDQQAWLIGAEYNLPNAKTWTVKGQYSQSTNSIYYC